MMRRGMPLYGYRAEGYWCDIGDLRAYLQCQRDLLAGKVKARFAPQIAQGIFAKGELPKGDFHLIPPVYIGENVEIAPGAQIGPDCVIDDHCFVGPGAKARFSVLLESAYLPQMQRSPELFCAPGRRSNAAALCLRAVQWGRKPLLARGQACAQMC